MNFLSLHVIKKWMNSSNKLNLNFFTLIFILFSLIIISLSLKQSSRFIKKSQSILENIKHSRLIKSQNCKINTIYEIPRDSTIVIGHLYGSPTNYNNFIDKNAQKFLIENKLKIKNLFLTGDIFQTPSKEKWAHLYKEFGDDMNIIIAPGNHDIGNKSYLKIFNSSIKQNKIFPIILEDTHNSYIFENSIKSGWHIKENIFYKIKNLKKNKNVFLLRHNIAAKELILLANSKVLLKENLPDIKKINNELDRNITIISGDGGAYKNNPRFFCKRMGRVKYIINGIGGIKGDSILIIKNNQIFKYKIN